MNSDWATNEIGSDDDRLPWIVEILFPWRTSWKPYKYYRTREAARDFVRMMRTLKLKTKHRVRKNK